MARIGEANKRACMCVVCGCVHVCMCVYVRMSVVLARTAKSMRRKHKHWRLRLQVPEANRGVVAARRQPRQRAVKDQRAHGAVVLAAQAERLLRRRRRQPNVAARLRSRACTSKRRALQLVQQLVH